MAKGSRGGQRAGGSLSGSASLQPQAYAGLGLTPLQIKNAIALGVTPQQLAQNRQKNQPKQNPPQQTNITPSAFSQQYDDFMKMTDDDKADVISQAIKQGVPMHLNDQSDFQKFIYNVGLNDKPDVVDDATLSAMKGKDLFRNVNAVYNKKLDVGFSADQIAKQVQAGSKTYVSSGNKAYYGSGIYFASNYRSSAAYGNTRGDIKQTAVMRAKFNSNAKIISYNDATRGVSKEISSGSKLGKTLSKVGHDSQASIYAMAKGYNVISNGANYYNILNRNAITMSKTVKAKGSSW